jgi:hypothetical protein
MVRDGFGGVAIRTNLEGVLVLDLEEVSDFSQYARDRKVIHPA